MVDHVATVEWRQGEGSTFSANRYSRAHRWSFDGGAVVQASSSPHVVPLPFSDPAGVDPEEALVAALASCHMLSFLYLAAKQGANVLHYRDEAVGELGKRPDGKIALLRAVLRPRIVYAEGTEPSAEQRAALHHEAHEICYIANSVNFPVVIEPPLENA